MGNITLVDELLGLAPQAGQRSAADFATTIAASNGMLIPLELLVQTRLSVSAELADAQVLKREYQRKSRLLDTDRRMLACLCDIVSIGDSGSAPDATALVSCIAALAPPEVPRLLACALDAAHDPLPGLLAEVVPVELIIRVTLDIAPREAAVRLHALHSQLATNNDSRLLAVLYHGSVAGESPSDPAALLRELAAYVDLLCLLPLLNGTKSHLMPPTRNVYGETVQHLELLGFARVAPALYARPIASVPQRPLPWLNRIMASVPQADVLGLGPAARSRFNEMHFDNHANPRDHARDLARGGYGIARSSGITPRDQFIDALLVKLASGSVVDVPALALRCQCVSPSFMESCERAIEGLRARGALGGDGPRCVIVQAANDASLPEVRAELAELRDAVPSITPLAKR